jgi:hypothetical protein
MVQDISPTRLMMLFTEGLMEPLKGWVKAFNPTCYPRYLGITRRSCLEAHMVLDMEYREQE